MENDMLEEPIKPFIKWAGGKRQLLNVLEQHVPQSFGHYYEPFVGAGALLFHLKPHHATINDYNQQLILAYKSIKFDVDHLIELLHDHKLQDSKEYYYLIRKLDTDDGFAKMSDTEKAARLIYLNKTCYNGLYRVNLAGGYNVPYGGYKKPAILDESTLRAVSRYLNRGEIQILNGDFAESVLNAQPNDFVYFDPPYYYDNNSGFTAYQRGGFDKHEHIRLKDVVDKLTECNVKVLVSNSDSEFVRQLYSEYEQIIVQARRHINSNSNERGYINELIVKNY